MAEALPVPTLFEDGEPFKRFRYPWKTWEAEPFRPWILNPGKDFPDHVTDPLLQMSSILRVRAKRSGLNVMISITDPEGRGRLLFCFYKDRKPLPVWSSNTAQANVPFDDENTVKCEICDEAQKRPPHLRHIKECLVRDINNQTRAGLFAKHRDMLPVSIDMKWSLEKGPFH